MARHVKAWPDVSMHRKVYLGIGGIARHIGGIARHREAKLGIFRHREAG